MWSSSTALLLSSLAARGLCETCCYGKSTLPMLHLNRYRYSVSQSGSVSLSPSGSLSFLSLSFSFDSDFDFDFPRSQLKTQNSKLLTFLLKNPMNIGSSLLDIGYSIALTG